MLFDNAEENWKYIDRISNSLAEIDDLITELPEHVFFEMLDYENNYPVPYDTTKKIEAISASIEDFDDEVSIKQLCSALLPVYDDFIRWLKPVKNHIDDKYKEMCRQIL